MIHPKSHYLEARAHNINGIPAKKTSIGLPEHPTTIKIYCCGFPLSSTQPQIEIFALLFAALRKKAFLSACCTCSMVVFQMIDLWPCGCTCSTLIGEFKTTTPKINDLIG